MALIGTKVRYSRGELAGAGNLCARLRRVTGRKKTQSLADGLGGVPSVTADDPRQSGLRFAVQSSLNNRSHAPGVAQLTNCTTTISRAQSSSTHYAGSVTHNAEEFRRAGHQAVDWVADFLHDPRRYPVTPSVRPGELTDRLPALGPDTPESLDAILRDFHDVIVPGATIWNHPRFLAYFATTSSVPGIIAELLSAALNSNGIHWHTSPAVTELEQVALGWLREWIGLPQSFFGIIYDTASVSSLHAIAAAREMADPQVHSMGGSQDLTLYTSEQSHSSIEKAAIALGIGQNNVRKVAADAEFRMGPEALEIEMARDRASNKRPFCVVATVGTTSSTSVDPVAAIVDVAARYDAWVHIDAAYAGPAAILPEFRWILAGAERAHSIVINPHKWLFTPMDLSAFYTRRPDVLRRAFSLVPEYLQTPGDRRAVNLMDYGVPLGRRFRGLKLWFILRYFGREGLQAVLREHIGLARRFADLVAADARFELAAPVIFSTVCFRLKESDEANRRLLERVNATHEVFLSHTVLNGKYTLRLAIGNLATDESDILAAWRLLDSSV